MNNLDLAPAGRPQAENAPGSAGATNVDVRGGTPQHNPAVLSPSCAGNDGGSHVARTSTNRWWHDPVLWIAGGGLFGMGFWIGLVCLIKPELV